MAEAKQISLLEQTVVDVINKSVSSIEKGAEFLAGQLPDIAEQYLRWKFTWAVVESLLIVIVLLILFFPIRKWVFFMFEKAEKANGYANKFDYWFPYWMLSTICFSIMIPAFVINIYTMVYIYAAPKVYLIEWAKSFL